MMTMEDDCTRHTCRLPAPPILGGRKVSPCSLSAAAYATKHACGTLASRGRQTLLRVRVAVPGWRTTRRTRRPSLDCALRFFAFLFSSSVLCRLPSVHGGHGRDGSEFPAVQVRLPDLPLLLPAHQGRSQRPLPSVPDAVRRGERHFRAAEPGRVSAHPHCAQRLMCRRSCPRDAGLRRIRRPPGRRKPASTLRPPPAGASALARARRRLLAHPRLSVSPPCGLGAAAPLSRVRV
jgi:hypothetical protein